MEENGTLSRRLEAVVATRMLDEAVIALQGPRSVGKSTLLRAIAATHAKQVIDLDNDVVRDTVTANPSLVSAGAPPHFIDEFQRAPEVLDAIKADLNRSHTAGRYVIAGSTRYSSLPRAAQALTGRLHQLTIWPLSQGELDQVHETFVARIMDDPASLVDGSLSETSRSEYVRRVTTGGMPLATRRSTAQARARWMTDYLQQVVERDVVELSRIRQRDRMPRVLGRLASQTGEVLNTSNVARATNVDPGTAEVYITLLESVFMVHRLPAWGRSLRTRSVAAAKIHLVDTGIAAHLLRLTPEKLTIAMPNALTEFGHLVETFAVNEILKQCTWQDEQISTGHWRTYDGDEVDLVLEGWDGRVVGIEVKAAERIRRDDARGLTKLRDALGSDFRGGVVLSLGPHSYTIDDRIHVLPLDRLWRVAPAM